MNQINIQFRETEIGEVVLGSFRGKLCLLGIRSREMARTVDDRIKKVLNAEFVERDDEILEKTRTQLDEYFQGHNGGGLSVKRRLLELERSNLADHRQDVFDQANDHPEDA